MKGHNKKIILVSNTSWSIYNFRLNLMEKLKNKGYKIFFCSPYDEYVEKLKKYGFKYLKLNISRKGLNPIYEIFTIVKLYLIYKRIKPSLTLHYTIKPNIYGTIAARLARINCINTITGLGYVFLKKGLIFFIVLCLYKLTFKYPKRIFFQNKDDLDLFLEYKIIKKDKAVLVNGSGIDINYFHPNFCKIDNKKTNFIFLFIGRLLWDKGIGEFVEASKTVYGKYDNVKILILGSIDKGNPRSISEIDLEYFTKHKYIKYLGNKEDVRPYLCEADCVVLPSYYREGIPRSLLEAMAMAKPIITTNVVGCKEVIEDGKNGYMIQAKDSNNLADAMIKMIEIGEKKRKEMGLYGRKKVEKEFDEELVINKYLKIIEEILGA